MLRRVAAIDIGSNAMRLIMAEIDNQTSDIKILRRLRAAIRLGADTFSKGKISPRSQRQAIATLMSFIDTMNEFGVSECRAVATSACREASNGREFIQRLRQVSGIPVQLIDSSREAALIHTAVAEYDPQLNSPLLVDIGGGSVEISFCKNQRIIQTQSFPLGALKMLQLVRKESMTEKDLPEFVEKATSFIVPFLRNNLKRMTPEVCIGTGGNMEALLWLKQQLFQIHNAESLNLQELSFINDILKSLSLRDRMNVLGLKEDRADVILPASLMIENIMNKAGVSQLRIPKVGVRDGLIWEIFEDQKASLSNYSNYY